MNEELTRIKEDVNNKVRLIYIPTEIGECIIDKVRQGLLWGYHMHHNPPIKWYLSGVHLHLDIYEICLAFDKTLILSWLLERRILLGLIDNLIEIDRKLGTV